MVIFVEKHHRFVLELGEGFGRLVTWKHMGALAESHAAGIPMVADTRAFVDFQPDMYRQMLERMEESGAEFLWCCVPDVVGDAETTMKWFHEWRHEIRFPLAFVLQDGQTVERVPWDEIVAVFIGGTTAWKFSDEVRELVAEGKRRGKWIHMGRVNTYRRAVYAKSIGCDSVDGSGVARFDHTREKVRRAARQAQQGNLW